MYGLNVNFKASILDKMLKIRCEKKVGGGANARLPLPLSTPLDRSSEQNYMKRICDRGRQEQENY